jgi:hypothetical protein
MQRKEAIYRYDNCHLDSAVAGFGELESPERVVFGLPATNSDDRLGLPMLTGCAAANSR